MLLIKYSNSGLNEPPCYTQSEKKRARSELSRIRTIIQYFVPSTELRVYQVKKNSYVLRPVTIHGAALFWCASIQFSSTPCFQQHPWLDNQSSPIRDMYKLLWQPTMCHFVSSHISPHLPNVIAFPATKHASSPSKHKCSTLFFVNLFHILAACAALPVLVFCGSWMFHIIQEWCPISTLPSSGAKTFRGPKNRTAGFFWPLPLKDSLDVLYTVHILVLRLLSQVPTLCFVRYSPTVSKKSADFFITIFLAFLNGT